MGLSMYTVFAVKQLWRLQAPVLPFGVPVPSFCSFEKPGAPQFHSKLIYVKVQNCAEVFCGVAERHHSNFFDDRFPFQNSDFPFRLVKQNKTRDRLICSAIQPMRWIGFNCRALMRLRTDTWSPDLWIEVRPFVLKGFCISPQA